jgi:formamidopyrimidine-DNA glycosylase
VEISVGVDKLVFSDGVNLRYLTKEAPLIIKHQLLIIFNDDSKLIGFVQMYGGLSLLIEGKSSNPYYLISKEKPNPLTDAFHWAYFVELVHNCLASKLNLKAFLATKQRIPGLGNGVLQDLLFIAKLNPKRKLSSLSENEIKLLFNSIKAVLLKMAQEGGRNTESDLLGKPGGYKVLMGSKAKDIPCPHCLGKIIKEAYMGGSIYYCPNCQKL